jgi:hypothetical protein
MIESERIQIWIRKIYPDIDIQIAHFRWSASNDVIIRSRYCNFFLVRYGAYHLKLEINYPTFKTLRLFY